MRTTILYVDPDTVSLYQENCCWHRKLSGHTPLSKTLAVRNDERRLLVKSGWVSMEEKQCIFG